MLTCREITELATDFAEGHLAEAERRRFVAHLAGCHGCTSWVRQLQAASTVVGLLPEPELPAALQATLQDQFEAWARERAAGAARTAQRSSRARWRVTWAPALAIAAAFGLLVGLGRSPSDSSIDWVGAGGLECLVTVGGVAALATGAAWAVLRREPVEVLGSAMGTWAVAGALASVAALQVACGANSSLAHLLVFHVGGLLAVIALAHLATRRNAGLAGG